MPGLVQAYSNSVATATVLASIQQADGKVILGGQFTSWNNSSVGRIVRLNADGTVDTSFLTNIGTGSSGVVNSIALQSDGKILVGGAFIFWNGAAVNRIVRLNSDGTLDTAFTTTAIPNGNVNSISIQSDGKIIIGGAFTTTNTVTTGRIARLNSDGTLDTTFTSNNGTGAASVVNTVNIQSDGKIIIGGTFTAFNGVSVGRFVRLNSGGTLDTAFTTNTGTAAADSVQDCKIQPDGKIVIVGDFKSWNGVTVGGIVRINSDGTRDTAFTTNVGTADSGNNGVGRVAIQSDGKIIAVGNFTLWSGATRNRIVRLNSDGTLDSIFATNVGTAASSRIDSISIKSDGSIVLGGIFTTWNGATSNYFVVLNSSGVLDTTYPRGWRTVSMPYTKAAGVWKSVKAGYTKVAGTWRNWWLQGGLIDPLFATNTTSSVNSWVNSSVDSSGGVIIGGNFTTFSGTSVGYIVRLNNDGTRDTTFSTNVGTGANGFIFPMIKQSDGKIIAGGGFTSWGGTTVGRIVRLNSDGTRDTAFTTNTGTGANNTIRTLAIQSDGKILIGGDFTTWNGVTVNRIVRLNSDGTRDTAFTTNTGTGASAGIDVVSVQSNGQIIVGGGFTNWNGTTVGYIVRLNSTGTRDTAFTTNVGNAANSNVRSVIQLTDNSLIIIGSFSSWNGVAVGRIVKLSSTGARDTTFTTNNGTGANSIGYYVVLQANNQIVFAGDFTSWNGTTVGRIVRLNSDGTRDTAFSNNVSAGANGTGGMTWIQHVMLKPNDNKLFLSGGFMTYNGISRSYYAQIGGDGAAV